MKIQSRGSEG